MPSQHNEAAINNGMAQKFALFLGLQPFTTRAELVQPQADSISQKGLPGPESETWRHTLTRAAHLPSHLHDLALLARKTHGCWMLQDSTQITMSSAADSCLKRHRQLRQSFVPWARCVRDAEASFRMACQTTLAILKQAATTSGFLHRFW